MDSEVRFTVHLVGSNDPAPAAQMRAAMAIAAHLGVSMATAAAGLAGEPRCVRQGLPASAADELAGTLRRMGAVVRVEPAAPAAARLVDGAERPSEPDLALVSPDRRITLGAATADVSGPVPRVDAATVVDVVVGSVAGAEAGAAGGPAPVDLVRCPTHGLGYDRRKASGCLRCMAPARAQARSLMESGAIRRLLPDAARRQTSPSGARRALQGLVIGLAVGFLPAAYHARVTVARDVATVRAEQLRLSAGPASAPTLARFDSLDAEIASRRTLGAARTAAIWVIVAAVAGAAYLRLARR